MRVDHKITIKKTRIKLYNTKPFQYCYVLYETWIIKASDARRITAAEMKCMRRKAGYTWTDYKTNAQIAKELKIPPIFGQITGIQEKLDTTCKYNASKYITRSNEIQFPNWQKESW